MDTKHMMYYAFCIALGIGFNVLGALLRLPVWFAAVVGVLTAIAIGLIIL